MSLQLKVVCLYDILHPGCWYLSFPSLSIFKTAILRASLNLLVYRYVEFIDRSWQYLRCLMQGVSLHKLTPCLALCRTAGTWFDVICLGDSVSKFSELLWTSWNWIFYTSWLSLFTKLFMIIIFITVYNMKASHRGVW